MESKKYQKRESVNSDNKESIVRNENVNKTEESKNSSVVGIKNNSTNTDTDIDTPENDTVKSKNSYGNKKSVEGFSEWVKNVEEEKNKSKSISEEVLKMNSKEMQSKKIHSNFTQEGNTKEKIESNDNKKEERNNINIKDHTPRDVSKMKQLYFVTKKNTNTNPKSRSLSLSKVQDHNNNSSRSVIKAQGNNISRITHTFNSVHKQEIKPTESITDIKVGSLKNANENTQKILSVLNRRIRTLSKNENTKDPTLNDSSKKESGDEMNKVNILLLLTRDFRVQDNWSVIHAIDCANKKKANLLACTYLNRKEKISERYIKNKLQVLKNLQKEFKKLNIPFYILPVFMVDEIMEFIRIHQIKMVICDFSPTREHRRFISNIVQSAQERKVIVRQVDSHNIVPLWITSQQEEYSARLIRSKINFHLATFLTEYIPVEPLNQKISYEEELDINKILQKLTVESTLPLSKKYEFSEQKAKEVLDHFIKKKLEKYNVKRNDPNGNVNSSLSPYLNFGLISSQRCVLEVNRFVRKNRSINTVSGKEAFNEEIIIRKELADNFCYYNKNYDTIEGAKEWARSTLTKHDSDERDYIYDYEDFKNGKTHDALWNCCQIQLIEEGIIHGYMRMYWAKKILEWTKNHKTALSFAIRLNDELAIDGKSANGYCGVMWSIVGIHDQGWKERNIFGKIRYMNLKGCENKFDVNQFKAKYAQGIENAKIVQKIPTISFVKYVEKRKQSPSNIKSGVILKKQKL